LRLLLCEVQIHHGGYNFRPTKKDSIMKTKILILAVAAGMMAASSAHAGWNINRATYAQRFSRPAPAQPARPAIQVAVLANSTYTSGATQASWFGVGGRSRALHGR
jgi:hypothetical protein